MQSIKYNYKKIFSILVLTGILIVGFSSTVWAQQNCPGANFNGGAGAPECLKVNGEAIQITHPAYDITNQYGQGGTNPWNLDKSKILIYELSFCNLSNYPTKNCSPGRGTVVGDLSTLKTLGVDGWTPEELTAYGNATTEIYEDYASGPKGLEWSIYPGEENIIYGLGKSSKQIVKYNVDDLSWTNVISYDPPDPIRIIVTGKQHADYDNEGYLVDSLGRDLEALGVMEFGGKKCQGALMRIFNLTQGWNIKMDKILDVEATNDKITLYQNTQSPVRKFNAGDSWKIELDLSMAKIRGWTKDEKLVVNFCQDSDISGLYEIDLSSSPASRTYKSGRPSFCTPEWDNHPFSFAIHGGRSPDGNYVNVYSASPKGDGVSITGAWEGANCTMWTTEDECVEKPGCHCEGDPTIYPEAMCGTVFWDPYNKLDEITHADWQYSDDWYVGGNVGTKDNAPHISEYRLYQVFFDRVLARQRGSNGNMDDVFTHNLLLTQDGAGIDFAQDRNYHGMISPTLRQDGKQVMFISTDGNYSLEDLKECEDSAFYNLYPSKCDTARLNWKTRGMFLADLVFATDNPADVNSDTHVNIKDIQACIKVITQSNMTYQDQCRVLAAPDLATNIKDIQVIIREIINPS